MRYKSFSENETRKIAKNIAQNLKSNVIALTGELGAGKTTFTQGFARTLSIRDKIISPTFVLIRQHKIPNSKGIFYHVDLYRLENPKPKELGLEDFWNDPDNIVLIEWAEKIKDLLPKKTIWINFENIGEKQRLITIY